MIDPVSFIGENGAPDKQFRRTSINRDPFAKYYIITQKW